MAGRFLAPPTSSPRSAGQAPLFVGPGAFNGDGNLDLAVVNNGSNDISIFLGDGTGSFTSAPRVSAGLNGPVALIVADLDGDGHLDLAVAYNVSNSVAVLLGDGTGHFTAASASPISLGTVGHPSSIASADFNFDGIPDLVVTCSQSEVLILIGDGKGYFAETPASPMHAGKGQTYLGVGDFNGDGNADLAVLGLGSGDLTIFLGDGTGSFEPGPSTPYAFGFSFLPLLYPSPISVADFNGDGIADLVIPLDGQGMVMLGDGTGGFAPSKGGPFNGTTGVSIGLAVADFDGDGRPDVVVGSADASTLTDGIFVLNGLNGAVLLGDGKGGLEPASWSPFGNVGSYVYYVATGDFNNDGRPDAVFVNLGGPPNVSVLVGGVGLSLTLNRLAPFAVGESGDLLLTVENTLTSAIAGTIEVVDTFPAGLVPLNAAGTGWTCATEHQTVTCIRSDGLQGNASFSSIDVSLKVTGAACVPIGQIFNINDQATILLNGSLVGQFGETETSSLQNCLTVNVTTGGPWVATQSATLMAVVQVAEGAPISSPPISVNILAPAMNLSTTAAGTPWRCTGNGGLISCSYTGAVTSPLPSITVTGTINPSACPTTLIQATVISGNIIQNTEAITTDLYGCITISQAQIDFGKLPYRSSFPGSLNPVVVTSIDNHPITVVPTGYDVFGAPTAVNCGGVGMQFGETCSVYAQIISCLDPPTGSLVITVDAGVGTLARYPVPVTASVQLNSFSISVGGSASTTISAGQQYPVTMTLSPAPDPVNCPQNVTPKLLFASAQVSPDSSHPSYDAAFDPTQSVLTSGTVADTLTLTAQVGGQNIAPFTGSNTISLTVPATAPVIQSVTLSGQTTSSFQLNVEAYSPTRETAPSAQTQVCLNFLAAAQDKVDPSTSFCALQQEIMLWYNEADSYQYGSQFSGNITVSFTGDVSAIGGVEVVVKNSAGNSAPFCAALQTGNKQACP